MRSYVNKGAVWAICEVISVRTIFVVIAMLGAVPAFSEPSRGWLTGEEGDFLQYDCSKLSDGTVECEFTQITMYLKQKPEEIEALIQERLPGVIEQFQQEDMGEVCQYMLPLQGLMEALMRGDEDEAKSYLSQMPEKAREDFDFAEAVDGVSRLDGREMEDMQAMLGATAKLCENPSEGDVEALMRLELEKEARTCKLWINNWTGTFRPISEAIWTLRSDGPEGQCGVQRLDRFECKGGSYSCEFISEKRILNPDAEPVMGIPCGDLEERAFRYEHDSDGVYLDCDIVSFF